MPKFGPGFRGASKRAVRDQTARMGEKMFAADEVRKLLDVADPTLTAMIPLGVNGGLGNNDIATLPISAVDLESGWINFARPKTGVPRRFPLWPETIAALRDVVENRPKPMNDTLADRLFLTSRGGGWVVGRENGRRVDKLVLRIRKLLQAMGAYRKQSGFYVLRHVCQTIGDECADPVAVAHVMGHADGTIGGAYRERISDDRVRRVTDYVRSWLFAEADAQPLEAAGLRVVK